MSLVREDPPDRDLTNYLERLGGKSSTERCFYIERLTYQKVKTRTGMNSYVGIKKRAPLSKYLNEVDAHDALLETVAYMRTVEAKRALLPKRESLRFSPQLLTPEIEKLQHGDVTTFVLAERDFERNITYHRDAWKRYRVSNGTFYEPYVKQDRLANPVAEFHSVWLARINVQVQSCECIIQDRTLQFESGLRRLPITRELSTGGLSISRD